MEGAENTQTQQQTQTETAQPAATATATPEQQPAANQATENSNAQAKAPENKKPTPADFFKQREDKREKKAQEQLADLQKKYAELESKLKTAPQTQANTQDDDIDVLSDPKAFREKTLAEARGAAEQILNEREAAANYERATYKAADFLLTRSHLKQDHNFAAEVKKVLVEECGHIGAQDPAAAAELAYVRVCQRKGVLPDMDGFNAGNVQNASGGVTSNGARPNAAAAGKKVWNSEAEAEKYVFGVKPGTKEYRARLAETDEARREGRIR